MTTITTRAVKGSPLSWSEADANFNNLNNDKAENTAVDLKAPLASPTFTGTPAAPTAAVNTNTTQVATTAFVNAEINSNRPFSDTNPVMDGTAAQGVSANISRQDHVHPSDTSRVAKAGDTMTGTLIGTLFSAPRDQLGVSATATNNFTLDASAADGTMKLARGNAGATTQDIMTVNAAGNVAFPATPGSVLQIVTHFDGGTSQSTSGWVNLTTVAASITPKSANSTLIVECFADVEVAAVVGVNAQAAFQIYSGATPPTGTFGNFVSPRAPTLSGGVGIQCGAALMGVVNNTDLTQKSYRLGASPTVGIPNTIGGTQQAWKITEVQN